jgi:uncharacterized protein
VIYAIFKSYVRSQANKPDSRSPTNTTGKSSAEDMVKCAHCGVNLPRSEAFLSQGKFFCSPEHQKLSQH